MNQKIKLTLIRKVQHRLGDKPTVTEHVIEARDTNELYAKCFRQYFNKEKYCNSTHTYFKDSKHKKPYHAWVSDINNYANNGGDMW